VKATVAIPTAWPRRLMTGPPLLPGLMLASTWIIRSCGFSSIFRSSALTIPAVAV